MLYWSSRDHQFKPGLLNHWESQAVILLYQRRVILMYLCYVGNNITSILGKVSEIKHVLFLRMDMCVPPCLPPSTGRSQGTLHTPVKQKQMAHSPSPSYDAWANMSLKDMWATTVLFLLQIKKPAKDGKCGELFLPFFLYTAIHYLAHKAQYEVKRWVLCALVHS